MRGSFATHSPTPQVFKERVGIPLDKGVPKNQEEPTPEPEVEVTRVEPKLSDTVGGGSASEE